MRKRRPAVPKRKIKDSVFTMLFRIKKYLVMLYLALHPEDTSVTESDIRAVTLSNTLANSQYNDLGFLVEDRLILLVEAQSTWSVNIVLREFLYLAQTYMNYVFERGMNLFSTKAVALPKPELYVICTAPRGDHPDELHLSSDIFRQENTAVDAHVKVIYSSVKGDIIDQYITFTHVLQEQIEMHGMTEKALRETIRICKEADVLAEFLTEHEKEVISMRDIFSQEFVTMAYGKEMYEDGINAGVEKGIGIGRAEGRAEGHAEGRAEGHAEGRAEGRAEGIGIGMEKAARNMLKMNFPAEQIAQITGMTPEAIAAL